MASWLLSSCGSIKSHSLSLVGLISCQIIGSFHFSFQYSGFHYLHIHVGVGNFASWLSSRRGSIKSDSLLLV